MASGPPCDCNALSRYLTERKAWREALGLVLNQQRGILKALRDKEDVFKKGWAYAQQVKTRRDEERKKSSIVAAVAIQVR